MRYYRSGVGRQSPVKRKQDSSSAWPELSAVLQVSGAIVAVWSCVAFTFATGFIFRIDPSFFSVLKVSDCFGIATSYAIYLLPALLSLLGVFAQLALPAPEKGNNTRSILEQMIEGFLDSGASIIIAIIVLAFFSIAPVVIIYLDNSYHFIDRSSLIYRAGDVYLFGLMALFFYAASLAFKARTRFCRIVLPSLMICAGLIILTYAIGDYAASVRINNLRSMDCAILEGSDRCRPILIWGEDYFITWSGPRMRAIPTDKIDHVWLHPYKVPDVRIAP